jgi:hypothetical protein
MGDVREAELSAVGGRSGGASVHNSELLDGELSQNGVLEAFTGERGECPCELK